MPLDTPALEFDLPPGAWDLSCPDWFERLKSGRAPIPDLPIDEAAAAAALNVYNELRLPDVLGHPSMGEAGGDWFRQIVRAAFGSADPVTGERAIGEILCLVPKKNSKTTNSAAMGLTALLVNKTPKAEMLIVAPTKDVADTCFAQAKGMIEADPPDAGDGEPYLPKRFHVRDHTKEIVCRLTGAKLMVKSFDVKVVTGKIPILVIIDELHVLGSSAHAAGVLTQLRGGMITRPDTLLLMITTQSDKPPAGVFKQELDAARRVRDGQTKGGNLLPILYEFPEEIQSDNAKPWRDPALWPLVLPNLGLSITLERLLRLYRKAADKGEDEETRWASQHLNIQVGLATHSGAWIGARFWLATADPVVTFDRILEVCDVAVAGIDGGGLDDLLALGVIGRHRETRDWLGWSRAWAHPEALKQRKEIAPRLMDFEAQGDLILCKDPTQDLREVAALCARIHAAGLFPKAQGIGLDPYGVAALIDELATHHLEGELLAAIGQGTRLSPAIWGMERKLKDGSFRHANQPLMDWCLGNAKAEQRGNALLITKEAAGKAKIDPLIAIFNAAMLMSRNPEAAGGASSPWDDPEFSMEAR